MVWNVNGHLKQKTAEALNLINNYHIVFLSELCNKHPIKLPIKNTKQINTPAVRHTSKGKCNRGMLLIIKQEAYKLIKSITKPQTGP